MGLYCWQFRLIFYHPPFLILIFFILFNLQTVDITSVAGLAAHHPSYNLGIWGLRNLGIGIAVFAYLNSSIPESLNP